MSNLSVLTKLEEELIAFQKGNLTAKDFVRKLNLGINGLENVPYEVFEQLRKYQSEIEIENYYREGNFKTNIEVLIQELKNCLEKLNINVGGK